ncbi:MAG: class I SAM-dependent methyltransferase [Lachnospiraceae bacterium]|nr:class I SAM-dependent methyltransferase [Lachnospiraceae bacterium]
MEAYTGFAEVYDTFMDNTPYEDWADFLESVIKKYGISVPVPKTEEEAGEIAEDSAKALETEKNLVLDLGCGTGTLTELMADKGYDMIGVDNSGEMLSIAMQKAEKSGNQILYLCQDMRELDLYSTVGCIYSVCDSLNYLLEDEDMEETFRQVHNYLYPGGIFIFDFNTLYKYRDVIGDTTIAENREDCSFIWENYFYEEEHVNEYDVTIFVKEEEGSDTFRRFEETHYQRGYTKKEMEAFVKKAGMKLLLTLDADTKKAPTAKSERIYMVAGACK